MDKEDVAAFIDRTRELAREPQVDTWAKLYSEIQLRLFISAIFCYIFGPAFGRIEILPHHKPVAEVVMRAMVRTLYEQHNGQLQGHEAARLQEICDGIGFDCISYARQLASR